MNKTVTKHNYQVGYRRVPTGTLITHSFENATAQHIMEVLTELEPDKYTVDVVFIVMIPDNATQR
jgi:hypothetical protein